MIINKKKFFLISEMVITAWIFGHYTVALWGGMGNGPLRVSPLWGDTILWCKITIWPKTPLICSEDLVFLLFSSVSTRSWTENSTNLRWRRFFSLLLNLDMIFTSVSHSCRSITWQRVTPWNPAPSVTAKSKSRPRCHQSYQRFCH